MLNFKDLVRSQIEKRSQMNSKILQRVKPIVPQHYQEGKRKQKIELNLLTQNFDDSLH